MGDFSRLAAGAGAGTGSAYSSNRSAKLVRVRTTLRRNARRRSASACFAKKSLSRCEWAAAKVAVKQRDARAKQGRAGWVRESRTYFLDADPLFRSLLFVIALACIQPLRRHHVTVVQDVVGHLLESKLPFAL